MPQNAAYAWTCSSMLRKFAAMNGYIGAVHTSDAHVQWAVAPQLGPSAHGTIAWLVAGSLVSGCFHPSYDRQACGPGGACPSGLQCSAQGVCEQPGRGLRWRCGYRRAGDVDGRTAG